MLLYVHNSDSDCWHITAVAFLTQWRLLFKVWTQLGECRYKFLCRWIQYGNHCGAQGWEVNQYQTGWIRASAWSFSCVDLFFFALFFSPHLHLLIGGRSWLSGLQSVYLSFLWLPSTVFAPWPSLEISWEEMKASVLLLLCLLFDSDKTEKITTPSSL